MAEVPYITVELSKHHVAKKASTGVESVRRSMPANKLGGDEVLP
jgi:hypothetical protein